MIGRKRRRREYALAPFRGSSYLGSQFELMRQQPGPVICVNCNATLRRPSIRCRHCHYHYRVAECRICKNGPTIVRGPYSSDQFLPTPTADKVSECLSCLWGAKLEMLATARRSAPAAFMAAIAPWLLSLRLSESTIRRLESTGEPGRTLTAVVVRATSIYLAHYAFDVLKGSSFAPETPYIGEFEPVLLEEYLKLNSPSKVDEKADSYNSRVHLEALLAWSAVDIATIYRIIPRSNRKRWEIAHLVVTVAATIKHGARLLGVFYGHTDRHELLRTCSYVDLGPQAIACYGAPVFALGLAGTTYERVKKWLNS